ncbi:hypothetical protein ciss_13360 [Carboxydothermus islandicus]|uniref:DUF4829 domain-containing protein n=1 Tax=Carboxydothermus islandicus TaxID=661089 RepID=A0A1L8D2M3_9THEO|nr:hypothetical protein [Carboxydothermus islandicus]GAV25403.1 hypothetical protein ciss_13360 [Carboxydothermus islandicus]
MKNISKRYLIFSLLFLFMIISQNTSIYGYSYDIEIKETIEKFYDTQYKAYLELEYKDITPFLDMTKIQNQNKVIALKSLVARRKYIDEKKYGYVEKRRFPVTFNYKKIEVKNNKAEVILVLEIDNQQAYPPFISSGINTFELKKEKGNWKIINHDYMKLEMFEISKTKKLPELNLEEMQKSIDTEFN